jgi:predicted DNA-binding transcriptional regulator AlpA
MQPSDPTEPLLDMAALARTLCMTIGAIRAYYKRGRIPRDAIIKIGRRVRFDPVRIRQWIDDQRKVS